MHVVLGREIVVQHSVDILEVSETGVLVGLAELGVWLVEVAAATASNSEGCLHSHR